MYRFTLTCTLCLAVICGAPPLSQAKDNEKSDISMMKRPETIRISTQGKIYIADEEIPLRKVAKKLKKEGVKQEDAVYVSIPTRTPTKALVAVSRELASSGYRRVIFTKPPKTIAKTGNNE